MNSCTLRVGAGNYPMTIQAQTANYSGTFQTGNRTANVTCQDSLGNSDSRIKNFSVQGGVSLSDFTINPNPAFRLDTINFTVNITNLTSMASCNLTVGVTDYGMTIQGQQANYSGTFSLGTYMANVICADVDSDSASISDNLTVWNWEQDVRLTNNTSNKYDPVISSSGSNIHIVWYDDRDGNDEIYYKNSSDSGVTWSSDYRLTSASLASFEPDIAVSGTSIHIVWEDQRDGNFEIYYKNSSDNGITWSLDYNLTDDVSSSLGPSRDLL
jgi:hypothetical protein